MDLFAVNHKLGIFCPVFAWKGMLQASEDKAKFLSPAQEKQNCDWGYTKYIY